MSNVSEAKKKANSKYDKKAYDKFLVRVPKGEKSLIADFAAKQGESVNGFVNRLIREAMGKEEK